MQMKKYRVVDPEETAENQHETAAGTMDPWQQYIADYEADFEANTSFGEQTIEEEFTTYILSLPKRSAGLDAVKFWEVCLSELLSSILI
jgi:hypothetical protein